MHRPVWFWQRIVSPHMAGLAAALAAAGRDVTYVAERPMSPERAAQGWRAPDLGAARLVLAPDGRAVADLVRSAPARSIHVCQGLRGNGQVGEALQRLVARDLRPWIVMETPEDSGWRGLARRLEYRRLIVRHRSRIEGILAIGHEAPDWLAARGMARDRLFPFAYFLPEPAPCAPAVPGPPFRILYAGQLVERKRVDLLIDALASLPDPDIELVIAGTGPLEDDLRAQGRKRLSARIRWLGVRPADEMPSRMAQADCLVLPSRHDGWGAVVCEALMAGTPAICSDRCGAAGVVRASAVGGVFAAGDSEALAEHLRGMVRAGRRTPERRAALARWARCLGAEAGAHYLAAILDRAPGAEPPSPPWQDGWGEHA